MSGKGREVFCVSVCVCGGRFIQVYSWEAQGGDPGLLLEKVGEAGVFSTRTRRCPQAGLFCEG